MHVVHGTPLVPFPCDFFLLGRVPQVLADERNPCLERHFTSIHLIYIHFFMCLRSFKPFRSLSRVPFLAPIFGAPRLCIADVRVLCFSLLTPSFFALFFLSYFVAVNIFVPIIRFGDCPINVTMRSISLL